VLLAIVSPRPIVKPLLTLVLLATAVAVHFMGAYGVILDTSMLRNLLHTDFAEARELVGRDILIAVLAYAAVPIALVWWPRLIRSPPRRAIARRVLAICGAWLWSWQPCCRCTVTSRRSFAINRTYVTS
jgi:lipid A ethanolaminephosphotransferase